LNVCLLGSSKQSPEESHNMGPVTTPLIKRCFVDFNSRITPSMLRFLFQEIREYGGFVNEIWRRPPGINEYEFLVPDAWLVCAQGIDLETFQRYMNDIARISPEYIAFVIPASQPLVVYEFQGYGSWCIIGELDIFASIKAQ
jgi:hypothetical protein